MILFLTYELYLSKILIINLDDLPFTLEIQAGVIVLIFTSMANFRSIGIRPSIFVL